MHLLVLARAPVTHGFMNGSLSSSSPRAVNGPPETAGYTLFPLHQTASRNAADEGKTSVASTERTPQLLRAVRWILFIC